MIVVHAEKIDPPTAAKIPGISDDFFTNSSVAVPLEFWFGGKSVVVELEFKFSRKINKTSNILWVYKMWKVSNWNL